MPLYFCKVPQSHPQLTVSTMSNDRPRPKILELFIEKRIWRGVLDRRNRKKHCTALLKNSVSDNTIRALRTSPSFLT